MFVELINYQYALSTIISIYTTALTYKYIQVIAQQKTSVTKKIILHNVY